MSDSLGRTRSRIFFVNGTLEWGNHAQWYGYVRHESGCLKGNERPLSMAAISMGGDGGFVGVSGDATFHFCNGKRRTQMVMWPKEGQGC